MPKLLPPKPSQRTSEKKMTAWLLQICQNPSVYIGCQVVSTSRRGCVHLTSVHLLPVSTHERLLLTPSSPYTQQSTLWVHKHSVAGKSAPPVKVTSSTCRYTVYPYCFHSVLDIHLGINDLWCTSFSTVLQTKFICNNASGHGCRWHRRFWVFYLSSYTSF